MDDHGSDGGMGSFTQYAKGKKENGNVKSPSVPSGLFFSPCLSKTVGGINNTILDWLGMRDEDIKWKIPTQAESLIFSFLSLA